MLNAAAGVMRAHRAPPPDQRAHRSPASRPPPSPIDGDGSHARRAAVGARPLSGPSSPPRPDRRPLRRRPSPEPSSCRLASEPDDPIVAAPSFVGASVVSLTADRALPLAIALVPGRQREPRDRAARSARTQPRRRPSSTLAACAGPIVEQGRTAELAGHHRRGPSYAATTGRSASRSRPNTVVQDGKASSRLHGPGGRHADRDRQPVRRLDDDRVVGQQADRPRTISRSARSSSSRPSTASS